MKGIIFTEFVDMVDQAFSPEVTDAIFDQCDLPSGGAYTSVGTYDHAEIVTLVTALSKETGVPVVDLVKTYGQHLFGRFAALYPQHFEEQTNSFDFLRHVENYIHVDVQKLYPDAELPRFEFEQINENYLVFYYLSSRHLGDVAEGLLRGCFAHFGESMDLQREDQSTPELAKIRFDLKLTESTGHGSDSATKAA